MGVSGKVGGVRYVCGNARLMEREGIPLAEQKKLIGELESGGHSLLFLADRDTKRLCGIMALRDTVKDGSADALRALHDLGLKTVLLTGDTEVAANAAASELRIDRVIAGVLPDGKEEIIRSLQEQGQVAMVGDGINDAPALVRADTGIAIGAGTDVAIDSADIVLMNSRLSDVPAAIIARRPCLLIKRIKHNIGKCTVNTEKCIGCKRCLSVGCPAVLVENKKARIDHNQCVGCTVCAQVCPMGAITREE